MITKLLLGVAITTTLVSAIDIDYGKAVDSVKVPEAIATVSKGTDMTMDDVTNSVDATKLTEAVMGSEDTAKATKEVMEAKEEVAKAKKVEEPKEEAKEESSGLFSTISSWF